MTTLRSKLIHLAHTNPNLRDPILQVLKQSALSDKGKEEARETYLKSLDEKGWTKLDDAERTKIQGELEKSGYKWARPEAVKKLGKTKVYIDYVNANTVVYYIAKGKTYMMISYGRMQPDSVIEKQI